MAVSVRFLTLLMMTLAVASPIRAVADDRSQASAAVRAARTAPRQQPVAEAKSAEVADEPAAGKTRGTAPTVPNADATSAMPSALSPQTAAMAAAARAAAKPVAAKTTTAAPPAVAARRTSSAQPTTTTTAAKPVAQQIKRADGQEVATASASATAASRAATAAPVTASRNAAPPRNQANAPTTVSRVAHTSEVGAPPRRVTPVQAMAPTDSVVMSGSPQVTYDPPQQERMLNPAYHPARVKRYGAGWYLAGAKPAGSGPGGEMIATPDPIYDNGGPMDGSYVEGDPSMGGYEGDVGYGGGMGMGGGVVGGSGLGGGGGGYSTSGIGPVFTNGRKYAVTAGAEMMWIRPRFSEATGMIKTDFSQSGANTQFFQTTQNFNPGYQGGFRTYLGFRDVCCGDEFRVTFFNLQAADHLQGVATSTTSFCDFLCNETPNPGDSVTTGFRLGASIWDMDCIRPFFFNPQCCNDGCNDCCGPNCPVWDLRWFAGLRFAYINHYINATVTDARNTVDGLLTDANSAFKFTGVGPRVGLQGRKYFGESGRWSIYSRGSGALLVGTASQQVNNTAHGGSGLGLTTNTLFARNARMVPVAEVELGATWWMLPRFAVSAGWNLQCFWDLGMQETGSATTPTFDDSNILGFDSLFVRGEFVF